MGAHCGCLCSPGAVRVNLMSFSDGRRVNDRWAAVAAVLSAPVAFMALYFYLAPLSFDLQALHRPHQVLLLSEDAIRSVRLGLLGDAVGYYLLYVPIIVHFRRRLTGAYCAPSGSLLDTASVCGLLYVALGVIGVVLQASVLPVLADGYVALEATSRAPLDAAWRAVAAASLNGFWFFECALIAIWLLVIGRACSRARMRGLSVLAALAGMAYAGAFITGFDRITPLSRALQMLALTMAPVWTFIVGMSWLSEGRRAERAGELRGR